MKPIFHSINRLGFFLILFLIFVVSSILLQRCGKTDASEESGIDPGFSAYISGYSGGVVSVSSPIVINLNQEVDNDVVIGLEKVSSLIEMQPDIDGNIVWSDNRTFEFHPQIKLKPNTEYKVDFYLGNLLTVPDKFETFSFSFRTMAQNFEVNFEGLRAEDLEALEKQLFKGMLLTADIADENSVEKVLDASQNGRPLDISWEHSENGRTHRFTVNNIIREEDTSGLTISWNGDPISVDKKGEQKINIPSLGDFRLLEARVIQAPEQYVSLTFSDPLDQGQDLSGLITLDNQTSFDFSINKNEIKAYPAIKQQGVHVVHIHEGIRNILDYRLKESNDIEVKFEQLKPAVRALRTGVILPSTKGMVFPFEAVNLKAVDVQVIRIYEENIPQFLQINDLDGRNELKRVGYPVIRKVFPLISTGTLNPGRWNRYNLDLSELIKAEPGAIYQVRIRFNKDFSTYGCGEEIDLRVMEEVIRDDEDWDSYETSYWDSFDYFYPQGYQWDERDNPCHVSYFNSDRFISHNILISDLGMLAKIGSSGALKLFVNNLSTTDPIPGVKLGIYDFQQQLIQEILTDEMGSAEIDPDKKPFLAIAEKDGQRGYLKLNDGNSLSLSSFDISGQNVQTGLKGYLYGERGVWRPGDSLHIAFILEDKNNLIPDTHPVIFEFSNPMGQITHKLVRTKPAGNIYEFDIRTEDDAPTGNWRGKAIIGGAEFSKTFKIETIKPNRIKINLDFGKDKLTYEDDGISGVLQARWLHGAVAGNLRSVIELSLSESNTTFEKYPEYNFDDPARRFVSEEREIFDGYLNGEGEARITARLRTDYEAPGKLMANFRTRVFEESGNFSIDRYTIPWYPYSTFVGIRVPQGDMARGMLLTDTTHTIRFVTLDASGKPVSRKGLQMEVYKLDWKWWWDSSEDYLGNYTGNTYYQPLIRKTINTPGGQGSAGFRIEYPEWGRFLVRVCDPVSGHCTGKIVYVDWPGWAGRARKDIPGAATMLSFSADKETYDSGEKIRLTIPGAEGGRALISIENGSKVLDSYWLNTRNGDNIFEFQARDSYAPNIYVHVTLLQPHNQSTNDLPIRLYGIKNLSIDDPDSHLDPVIQMPDVLKPEQKFTVKVTESNKKQMNYTLAIVDDGLLDLTRFQTPDPWDNFYAKESLGVKTWDIYDDVIGAFGGEFERLLAIGGDAMIERPEGSKANRFEPVVLYAGPFELRAGKTNQHEFSMPQYIGSVRAMVVAAHDGAYGNTDKTIPVRQELMVLGTLPRVLGPGESLHLPVNVFVYNENISEIDVNIQAGDMIRFTESRSKSLSFSQTGDKMVYFPFEVKPELGVVEFDIKASSGSRSAGHTITIDVRNPNLPVTKVFETNLEAGDSWDQVVEPMGMKGTNSALLEISTIPPIDFGRRLRYLLNYPHGCIEQTVSTAFPQLFLEDVIEVNETTKRITENNIKEAIRKIADFQNLDGGFKYWPNQTSSDDWSSSYTGHFLLEAKNKGFAVNDNMLNNWIKFQKKAANRWRKNAQYERDDLIQAYRLYTLALANEPVMGAMNRLREESLSMQAAWRLSAAYALAGQINAGVDIINGLGFDVPDYQELSNSYGSHRRDEAMILETLALLDKKTEGMDMLKKIAGYLSNQTLWMSTQTTAYCLIGVSKFIEKEEIRGKMKFTYTLNNKSTKGETTLPLIQKSLEISDGPGSSFTLKNEGDAILFARLLITGTPLVDPGDRLENSLRMQVLYKDMNGEIINIENLRQGEDLIAEVVIKNPGIRGNYEELALTQIFPSGFEIINQRMDNMPPVNYEQEPDYQDIRDDRVMSYFDLNAGKTITIRTLLNASYQGRFYLPAVNCEAMYDRSISARIPGKWIEITGLE